MKRSIVKQTLLSCSVAFVATLLASGVVYAQAAAQTPPAAPITGSVEGSGSLSGKVTADKGEVRALRVKVKDTKRGIAYVVFTKGGRYSAYNLAAGMYEVQILERNYKSEVSQVELMEGANKTVDLSIAAVDVPVWGTGANMIGSQNPPSQQLVSYDELYPPGPTRDLLEQRCFACHGPSGWHLRGGGTPEQWYQRVSRMWQRGVVGSSPMVDGEYTSEAQKQEIVDYLAKNFPPGHPSRDLKPDALPRDEKVLARAVYTIYDVPPLPTARIAQGLRRGTHDVFPSLDPARQGWLWIADIASGAILRVDTKNPDPIARFREYVINDPNIKRPSPHGIQEANGHVYWPELGGDHIGDIDIASGAMIRTPAAQPIESGGGHTARIDSKGNVWFTEVGGEGAIGRMDPITHKVVEWSPVPGAKWYGVVIDKQDRVWVAATGAPNPDLHVHKTLAMYDQRTEAWKVYEVPNPLRRITLDSKGNVWANEYWGGAEIMLDPDTGKITRHLYPVKRGAPYEGYIDKFDRLWVEDYGYQVFHRMDLATQTWTNYPFPDLAFHTPKVEQDQNGDIWFGGGRIAVSVLKVQGNVPKARVSRRD